MGAEKNINEFVWIIHRRASLSFDFYCHVPSIEFRRERVKKRGRERKMQQSVQFENKLLATIILFEMWDFFFIFVFIEPTSCVQLIVSVLFLWTCHKTPSITTIILYFVFLPFFLESHLVPFSLSLSLCISSLFCAFHTSRRCVCTSGKTSILGKTIEMTLNMPELASHCNYDR